MRFLKPRGKDENGRIPLAVTLISAAMVFIAIAVIVYRIVRFLAPH